MDQCLLHSEHDTKLKKLISDVSEIFDRLRTLETKQPRIEQMLDDIKDDLKEIKANILALNKVPEKRWDTIVTVMITAVVSAGVTFVISQIVR